MREGSSRVCRVVCVSVFFWRRSKCLTMTQVMFLFGRSLCRPQGCLHMHVCTTGGWGAVIATRGDGGATQLEDASAGPASWSMAAVGLMCRGACPCFQPPVPDSNPPQVERVPVLQLVLPPLNPLNIPHGLTCVVQDVCHATQLGGGSARLLATKICALHLRVRHDGPGHLSLGAAAVARGAELSSLDGGQEVDAVDGNLRSHKHTQNGHGSVSSTQ